VLALKSDGLAESIIPAPVDFCKPVFHSNAGEHLFSVALTESMSAQFESNGWACLGQRGVKKPESPS
jgi:hypothetical protein